MNKLIGLVPLLLLAFAARAEIVPEAIPSPVELHYAGYVQKLQNFPDHAARVKFLREEKAKAKSGYFHPENKAWADNVFRHYRSNALTFQWKCTAGEKGPFVVEVSETPDFSEPQIFVPYRAGAKGWETQFRLVSYHNNLKIGTKYYWRVAYYDLDRKVKTPVYSAVSTFETQDLPPRQLNLESTHYASESNMRDVGGWKTVDGRRVRQGVAFRSAAFGETSTDTIHPGRIHFTIGDRNMLVDAFKVKTDLDLRTMQETGETTQSPLGGKVQYRILPVPSYEGAFTAEGKAKYGAVFHFLAKPENYPLIYHCVGGADRTATLTIFLNGLLGVSRHDLEYDWECTFLPDLPCLTKNCQSRCCSLVFKGLDKYGKPGDSLSRKIELYLHDCGVTDREIRSIRSIFLEDKR